MENFENPKTLVERLRSTNTGWAFRSTVATVLVVGIVDYAFEQNLKKAGIYAGATAVLSGILWPLGMYLYNRLRD